MSLLEIIASRSSVSSNLVVADTHRVIDGNGDNVSWLGDTPWTLPQALSQADATNYIDNRAAKGVKAMIIEMVEKSFDGPDNLAGDPPFDSNVSAGNLDFTDPNAAYWTHIDWIIDYCATKGIYVFCWPAYIGFDEGPQGWATVMIANGTTRMATYGTWLGNRYKDKTNIVWVHGGDSIPTTSTTQVNALANALKAADPNHLHSAHSARGRSALDDYNEIWLDVNSTYGDLSTAHSESRAEWQRATPLPAIGVEFSYVNEGLTTDLDGMRQAMQSLLAGAWVTFHGSSPLWNFNSGYDTAINTDGAQYFTYINRLLEARDIPSLTPDFSNAFITSSRGTEDESYSPCVASSSILVALHNGGEALTYDLSQFSGSISVRWYSPIDGTTQTHGSSPFSNSGSQVMTPPTSADWVLLIDLVSLSLDAP